MADLILLRPWWLAAFLPLALLLWWVLRRPAPAGGWERVMSAEMLTAMQALGAFSGRASRSVRLLPIAALVPLILGLTGPALPREDLPLLARTDTVLLAIDTSASVAEGKALSQAQQAAAALLQRLPGRPVGLILYGNEAFAASAPTTDPRRLETLIAVLDAGIMPARGSSPGAAIGLAAGMLADPRQSDLILISDGGGVDRNARAEAARLSELGTRIWAVRVDGVAAGAPVPEQDAMAPLASSGRVLDWTEADDLAARLGGRGERQRVAELQAFGYRDLGPLLAAFAGLPLLMMLRRRS
ncbi:VWA domain-containing protein [Paracoccus rhizosphaerae]|uniref:VWA domain-containing protein n=1 Tax=Paracoccus rhizosphaerae TaxID=1133347 RepID=A0ABV6CNH6_9RHOB|nr:VWA domain-containing protein [Paracoccus rhizosphaerae]